MSNYLISLDPHDKFENPQYENIATLTDEQLCGIAAMSTVLLGDERDDYFGILKEEESIDLDGILDEFDSIVCEGESVEFLEPSNDLDWLDSIEGQKHEYGLDFDVNQKYTLRSNSDDKYYLFQFDEWDFIRGAYGFCMWMGLDPKNYLSDLHRGNKKMDLP